MYLWFDSAKSNQDHQNRRLTWAIGVSLQVTWWSSRPGGRHGEEEWPDARSRAAAAASTMTRLMLGRTLERICKGVLLLCLVHFLIMMILYFDVYSQRFDIFSRFNNGRSANASRANAAGAHHYYYYNSSRPNATFANFLATADQLLPSGRPEANHTPPTPKPIPPCPEVPPGLGKWSPLFLIHSTKLPEPDRAWLSFNLIIQAL